MEKKLPTSCPSCQHHLNVEVLHCPNCDTKVVGDFGLPELMLLSTEDQKFILEFIKTSGSIKLMAAQLKLSYPTVRNMLDDIIEKIKTLEK